MTLNVFHLWDFLLGLLGVVAAWAVVMGFSR